MLWPRRSFCRSRSARIHLKPPAQIESLLSCALVLLLENYISTLYYGSGAVKDTLPSLRRVDDSRWRRAPPPRAVTIFWPGADGRGRLLQPDGWRGGLLPVLPAP